MIHKWGKDGFCLCQKHRTDFTQNNTCKWGTNMTTLTNGTLTLSDFISQNNLKVLTVQRVSDNPANPEMRNMDHWKVLISAGKGIDKHKMTVYLSKGYGHSGKEPEIFELMECLIHDALDADMSFKDWSSNLGYDSDSRKAESIFKEVKKSAKKLQSLLGHQREL